MSPITIVITTIIRFILSIVICVMIYKETGAWTTFFAVLMIITCEADGFTMRLLNKKVTLLEEHNLKTNISSTFTKRALEEKDEKG